MSKRIIYSYMYGDDRKYLVDYLHDQCGWDPVFFHGLESMRDWVGKKYPQALLADGVSLRRGHFDYRPLHQKFPVDAAILEALSKHESSYLNWLEDASGWEMSFYERRRYYHEMLTYWNTVIHQVKPDVLVTYTWPHLPSDYPLYLLCTYYYQIPVLFLNPIPLLDNNLFVIGNSLENLATPFEKLYRSSDQLELSLPVKEYLDRLRSSQAKIPSAVARYLAGLDKQHQARYQDLLTILKLCVQGKAFSISGSTFKKNRQPLHSDASQLTCIEEVMFKRSLAHKVRRLKKFYNTMTVEPRLDQPYFYFPGPYQPEVLSNLSAGVYEDVLLVLDMISSILPEGWLIYYKEHPNTFKEADKGALARSEEFYNKLNSFKNVRLIKDNFDTFALTSQAKAVCTIGGTAGWEAVVRGKPALFFGSTWYQACQSVFVIKTREDARLAVDKIIGGFVVDNKDVERYAETIFRTAERGLMALELSDEFQTKLAKSPDPKADMQRIGQAFVRAYDKYYGNRQQQERSTSGVL